MCGIAGILDLRCERQFSSTVLQRMAAAIRHRGPDETGYFRELGIGLASQRLSIVDLEAGQQPVYNEDRSIVAVFNGELFDHPEQRDRLRRLGHSFRTACDSEILVHLWEEYGEEMFPHLRGQFAFALWDRRKRVVILARDRVGICPLHWARRDDVVYFGSEIKAILASGAVEAKADLRGLDHLFTFFAMPSGRTAFEGISAVSPGGYLRMRLGGGQQPTRIEERSYWDHDFPDHGDEEDPSDEREILEEFREKLFRAVEVRLRADTPVVGYLSGGIDSASVLAVGGKLRDEPIPSFTIKIDSPGLDEEDKARQIARHLGSPQTVIRCTGPKLAEAFPDLIRASDSPVVDTACTALHALSAEVNRQGYKVALTGEGADEALGGYPWFKIHKLLGMFDFGALKMGDLTRRAALAVAAPTTSWRQVSQSRSAVGGALAPLDVYALMLSNRRRFYSDASRESLGDWLPFEDLELDHDRSKRWHPFNQSLYLGYKTILPGLLLSQKGDRVAMANSVETRYPFLDEDLMAFCAKLAPRWKLRGILRDKVVLRRSVADLLPRDVIRRPKAMFRAPFGETFFTQPPPYLNQLLSEESLRRTGYFDPSRVRACLADRSRLLSLPGRRLFKDMGLTAVMATQLWHHLYLGGELCDLPTWQAPTIETDPVELPRAHVS